MKTVILLFLRGASTEEKRAGILESALTEAGYRVEIDRHLKISLDWARSVDERIRGADCVIALLSRESFASEMMGYELDIVSDARLRNRLLQVVSVPLDSDAAAMAARFGGFQTCVWADGSDTPALLAEILSQLESPAPASAARVLLGPMGGAVSANSPYYIERQADSELSDHFRNGEPTILIKGPRQSGKSSLIAQGIARVRESNDRPVLTDFQQLGSNCYADENEFYRALAARLGRQLKPGFDLERDWEWDAAFGPASNLDEFVREMVSARTDRLVWFMDEADWLFGTPFADSFFALVRSWHNARALSPDQIWNRFSAVIAYATEAHLFIQDINQSPFNVGRRIEVQDFTLRQTEELNARYGEPLRGIDQVLELQELLGGQPFLTRAAYDSLLRTSGNLRGLLAAADRDDGPFADHLRRILVSVTQLSPVRSIIERALNNEYIDPSPDVYRLIAAGILARNSAGNHVIRCKLYRRYLKRYLT